LGGVNDAVQFLGVLAALIAAIGSVLAAVHGIANARKLRVVESKMDGPLAALIDSIKAEAEAKVAIARAETSRRISQAFAAGQDQPHTPDPATVKAIAVEAVRVANEGNPTAS
jgi:ArsR family metal-binding transcriptional regulator